MLMYLFYYLWRHNRNSGGIISALYIVSATIYSIYACGWVGVTFALASGPNLDIIQDFIADWSTWRIRAKYPLLRDEVMCTDHIPVSESLKSRGEESDLSATAILFRCRALSLNLFVNAMK